MDTETTGLTASEITDDAAQPRIIEFAALKLDDETLEEVDYYHALINPGIPLADEITKITGLTDKDLKDAKKFAYHYPYIAQFFRNEWSLVAHNLPFDRDMLSIELKRLDRLRNFPWPYFHLCTAELTKDIQGFFSKQEWLYEHYVGKPAEQTHRALDDVRQLAEIVRFMRRENRI